MEKFLDIKPLKKEGEGFEKAEKEEKIPHFPKKSSKKGLIFLVIFFLLIFSFLILNFFSFAQVEVKQKTERVEFEKELSFDKNLKSLDFSKDVLPAQILEYEKTISQEFLTTGKKFKEEKATGMIKIINKTTQPQTLVANTRFISTEGKLFRSLSPVTVPAARYEGKNLIPGEIEIQVKADQPGEEFNIGPSKFSIPGLAGTPKYNLIYGESSQSMRGGIKKEVLAVSEDDLKRAKDFLTEKIKDEGGKLIVNDIPQVYFFSENIFKPEILNISCSATSSQEVEKFNCQLKAKIKTIVFLKSDLEQFLINYIKNLKPEKEVLTESLFVERKLKNYNFEEGKISFSFFVKAKVYRRFNEIDFKKQLANLPLQEAKMFLNQYSDVESFKIKVFPFWVKNLPENLDKIKIKITLD